MPYEVVMPQLGLSMDYGKIAQWLKKDGEHVQEGEIFLEIESDKAIVEVEAVQSGTLHILKTSEDGSLPIGDLIAYLLAEGESPPTEKEEAITPITKLPSPDLSDQIEAEVPAKTDVPAGRQAKRPPSSPAARRRAKELGVDWRKAKGTGPGGRIKEQDVALLTKRKELEKESAKLQISPLAECLASEFELSLHEIAKRFPDKRIERQDIIEFVRERLQQGVETPTPFTKKVMKKEPISGLRRLIANRMTTSSQNTAPVTHTTEADATEIYQFRENLKKNSQIRIIPSYNAILAYIVTQALLDHTTLNSSIEEDELVIWEIINIGIAVETDRGLVVPVIHNTQSKSLYELSVEMSELLERAALGKCLPDELTGGTFTITNLGNYDIDAFTPIINLPECAILGVGRLMQKPIVITNQITIRTMMALSLTFDHRIVDGAPAASFLKSIKSLIENPTFLAELSP